MPLSNPSESVKGVLPSAPVRTAVEMHLKRVSGSQKVGSKVLIARVSEDDHAQTLRHQGRLSEQ